MAKNSMVKYANATTEILIVLSVLCGFRRLLETIFGCGDIVSYIGSGGGALLAALSIMLISGAHKDEKELEELREKLRNNEKEDQD